MKQADVEGGTRTGLTDDERKSCVAYKRETSRTDTVRPSPTSVLRRVVCWTWVGSRSTASADGPAGGSGRHRSSLVGVCDVASCSLRSATVLALGVTAGASGADDWARATPAEKE